MGNPVVDLALETLTAEGFSAMEAGPGGRVPEINPLTAAPPYSRTPLRSAFSSAEKNLNKKAFERVFQSYSFLRFLTMLFPEKISSTRTTA